MSIDCKSPQYKAFVAASACYIVLYITGMIVAVVYRLWINEKKGYLQLPSSAAHQKYAFFFIGYRDDLYFWEAVIMARKIAIVAFSVLPSSALQLVFGNVIVTIAWALNTLWIPFSSRLVNQMESISLIAVYVTIIFGLLFLLSSSDQTEWITALVIIVNVSTLIFLLACCGKRMRALVNHILVKIDGTLLQWRKTKTDGIEMTEKGSKITRLFVNKEAASDGW